MQCYLKIREGAKLGCLGSPCGSSSFHGELAQGDGDFLASGDLPNTCDWFLQQSRMKPTKSQEIYESLVKQEWNQKPSLLGRLIYVTNSFFYLLTPSIVGTFIYSDILSDSWLGSDDWTRRNMRFSLRRGTAWFEYTLMSCDSHERGRHSAPCFLPHHLPQQRVTAASHNYNAGQYLQHNESMYTWTIPLACFRNWHTRSHTCTPTWERETWAHTQRRKLKWHFLAFAAWLVLSGVVRVVRSGMARTERKRKYLGWRCWR